MVVEPLDEESMQVEANTEATSTETPTLEPTPTVQNTPEQGDLGETPTETPSETPTPTGTPTQEPAPTETGIPEPTLEPTLSETPEAVETQPEDSSEQSTPDQVETLIPQPTETPTLESTSTETPTPTETQMDTPLPEDFENPDGESLFLDWEGGEIVYTYDGDGNLVKSVIDNKTTYYPNQYYEKRLVDAQQTIFKYYFVGSARIALWENGTITWLLSDHLGSTSGTVNATGALVSTMKYTAFGETRGTGSSTIDYRYYGQREEEEIGLYFYRARWYDPYLNHFTQPDTIIPDPANPQSWNRYTYVNNNPINFNDPSGHYVFEDNPEDPYWLPAVNGIMTSRRSTKDFAYTPNERKELIFQKANILAIRQKDSLVASTELIRYSSSLYRYGDINNFIIDITCVINGYCSKPIGVFRLGLGYTKDQTWWLNYDVFHGKGSWSSNYYDFTNNQLYHFWFYVATSYLNGYPLSLAANFTHDPPIDILEINGRIPEGFSSSPWVTELAENGRSYQDYLLGKKGAKLGFLINIGSVNHSEVADWMWRELSWP